MKAVSQKIVEDVALILCKDERKTIVALSLIFTLYTLYTHTYM